MICRYFIIFYASRNCSLFIVHYFFRDDYAALSNLIRILAHCSQRKAAWRNHAIKKGCPILQAAFFDQDRSQRHFITKRGLPAAVAPT